MSRSTGLAATTLGGIVSTLGVAAPQAAEADAVHELSVADAVRAAITSDADLYIAREDTRVAADGISLARSAFATRLFGQVWWSREDQPPAAKSFGGIDTVSAGELGIAGRIRTGMTYTIGVGLARQETKDDPFSTVYDPALTTTVRADIVQPLRRGAFGAARRPIVVAALRRDRSAHELLSRIERTVGSVQVAYWDLVRARSERDARTSAVALAKEQVDESKRLSRLGTGADLDVTEAEAGVSRRQQELLRSEREVVDAEGRLFEAMGVRPGDKEWNASQTIVPTDTAPLAPTTLDLDAQLALGRSRRADVLAARLLIAAETAELDVTDDRRRAALDVVAAAGTVGFGGSLASSYATAGINGAGLDPPFQTDVAYDGGLLQSLRNTAGRDIQLYIGLRFEMPLGDHEADVRHTIQQRSVARARLVERETLARIDSEVRTTVARVDVDAKLVEAADHAVALTQKLLEGTRKRFRAGASTSFDVLRVSEELTRARVEAARARADYGVSLTRLAAATGTLLEKLGITVKSLGTSPR